MEYGGWVYMLTNPFRSVLYTGVTSDLLFRLYQHETKAHPGSFSAQYNATILIYYEWHDSIEAAIAREKQIKGYSRKKKNALVGRMNPRWEDLTKRL